MLGGVMSRYNIACAGSDDRQAGDNHASSR